MSYLVLARKYRPQTFEEVIGQVPIVKTLQNSLLRKRVAHAILFSGVRGVGKTTLARIMAKAINCEGDSKKVPCNNCRSCVEITKGSALDLYEIDGASNRGIQEIRELKEKIRFLPSSSTHKIIIIDEVHMLTTEAFNALLKTLEEPPEHVYFMFATTELHKIPITILSRCQRYELKRVTAAELTRHFEKIAASEEIKIESSALSLIVREAEGSVRDGMSLLDQMFSFGDSHISNEDVIQLLGLTDRNALMTITRALFAEDRATALKTLEAAFEYGIDIKRFTSDLLQCFRTLMLIKIGNCPELIDLPLEEIDGFHEIAKDISPETIHLKLTLLMQAIEDLRYTTQPRLTLETAFIKIIEAANIVPVSTLLGKIDSLIEAIPQQQLETTSNQGSTKKKEPHDNPSTVEDLKEKAPYPPPPPEMSEEQIEISSAPEFHMSEQLPEKPEPPPSPEKLVEVTPPSDKHELEVHPNTHDVRRDWDEFITYVKDRKIWMSQDLQRSDSAKEVGTELHLFYSDPTNCALLRERENKKLLTEFVLDFFQKDLKVRFILPDLGINGGNGEDPESPHKLRQQLSLDPLVQMTVEIFNGQIGDIRIGPRSR